MKNIAKLLSLSGAVLSFLGTSNPFSAQAQAEYLLSGQHDFYNLINIKNVPQQESANDLSVFSDLGA